MAEHQLRRVLQGLALQTFLRKNAYDVEMVRFPSWQKFPPSSPSSVICRVAESDYEDIRRSNTAVCRSPLPHPRRARFFAKVGRTDDFDALVTRLLRPTLYQRIRSLCGRILRKLHLRAYDN